MLAWYLAVNKKVMFLGSFVGIAIRDIYIYMYYIFSCVYIYKVYATFDKD